MENIDGNGGCRLVVTELSHIKDLVLQLEVHLDGSPDLCRHLTAKIVTLTERSIGIITSSDFESSRKRHAADAGLASATPRTLSTKKRKMMEKRTNQVRVSSAGGGQTPLDDGHSWRKYGQKEILGAKYPRGYYRCTHKHSQGCTATKQLQRTDEDPALFDVFYLGTHTCVHKMAAAAADSGEAAQPPEHNPDAQSLTVKTEGLAVATTPFSLSSTPASVGVHATERSPLSAPSTSDNWGVSPATSDSNNVASFFSQFEWRAQSELHDVVSALVAASTPSLPAADIAVDEFLDIDAISSFFA